MASYAAIHLKHAQVRLAVKAVYINAEMRNRNRVQIFVRALKKYQPFAPAFISTVLLWLAPIGDCISQVKSSADCVDRYCPGDTEPKRNLQTESAVKLGGQWYVGPKEYFSNGLPRAGFEWRDHQAISPLQPRPAPMQRLIVDGKGHLFSVEMFPRSTLLPVGVAGWYDQLLQREINGEVVSKERIRPGLELWKFRESASNHGGIIYVATQARWPDGRPAVVGCDAGLPENARCTTGFFWRPDIWVGIRFSSGLAQDLPEIQNEVLRVMNLLKKVM